MINKVQAERESYVKVAGTKIRRIDQITRRAEDLIGKINGVKDQINVLIGRNLSEANDINELKDLFKEMDKIRDSMENL